MLAAVGAAVGTGMAATAVAAVLAAAAAACRERAARCDIWPAIRACADVAAAAARCRSRCGCMGSEAASAASPGATELRGGGMTWPLDTMRQL